MTDTGRIYGSGIRTFGRKKYYLYQGFSTKARANSEVKRIRKDEKRLARIVEMRGQYLVFIH